MATISEMIDVAIYRRHNGPLQTLYLGVFCTNKAKTILEMKDVVIFRGHSGTIYTLSSYVSVIVFREK